MSRAGFNRATALATATMTLAAEAPDLDTLWLFKGPVVGFAHHRGFTHSFLGLIAVAALVTGFMYVVWRLKGKRTNIANLPPRWGLLFGLAYLAGLSHILLDFTNNYGVRPFWPFSERWHSWDIVSIIEPALYLFLLLGLLVPELVSRHKPLPRGLAAARVALVCMAGLYALRDYEHRHALHAVENKAFAYDRFQPERPVRSSAYPYMWTVFRWHAVAEARDFFVSSDVDSRSEELNPAETEFFPKPAETPAIGAAKRTHLGRVYLDWASYPWVTETSSGEDAIVYFRDLRFARPLRATIALSGLVELNKNLEIVREQFASREQRPPLD